jgi:eukaryotic-like serine/threonine-protein kinase
MREGSLTRGTTVGRFTVEELIGAGGMGEVYAARDSNLGRRVALKILPTSRVTDTERVERFVREARAASSLNHPAIVTIFDSGTDGHVPFLAMELIDGQTLTQWVRAGRNGKVAAVLTQVAEGLARAHASGIVHRDLKPDNIMVARGGYAKILDFGIAKLTERQLVNGAMSSDTAPASMLGTAAFMSPEQVEGRSVDHRSDIFSFGCVIYAAFQGRSPFERDSSMKTMNAVVNDDPPPLSEAPPYLQRIARRCLNKDPDERYQSMKDVALDLREGTTDAGPVATRRPTLWVWIAAALLFTAILGMAIWIRRPRPRESPQVTMQRVTNSGRVITGAMSADGKYVVHATLDGDTETVWVRQIATGTDVRIIPPTDGFYGDMKVSPDGNYVFYGFAPRNDPNVEDIYQIPILGGESRKVVGDIDGMFTLSPDGRRIAFRRFSAIKRDYQLLVSDIESGSESLVLKLLYPQVIGGAPAWSPDGRHLTFVTGTFEDLKQPPAIAQLDLTTGQIERMRTPPWPNVGTITWLPDGSGMIVCAAERQQPEQIWFIPAGGGPPKKITSDLASYGGVSVTSDSQTLASHRQENSVNLWLVSLDHPEKARALTTGLGSYFGTGGVRWISDREIVYTVFGEGGPSLKALDVERGESRQVTRGYASWNVSVSPDRSRVAFVSDRTGKLEVWVCDTKGNDLRQVTHGAVGGASVSFFPDNRSLVYISYGKVQAAWRTSIDNDAPVRLTDRPANSPQVSPDGKWLLCRLRSVEPDAPLWRTAILPIDGKGNARYYPIPRAGGPHAFQWMPDGRAFAFIDTSGSATNVFVQNVDGGQPRQITRFDSGRISAYHISPDGKSIVVSRGDPVNDIVLIRGF